MTPPHGIERRDGLLYRCRGLTRPAGYPTISQLPPLYPCTLQELTDKRDGRKETVAFFQTGGFFPEKERKEMYPVCRYSILSLPCVLLAAGLVLAVPGDLGDASTLLPIKAFQRGKRIALRFLLSSHARYMKAVVAQYLIFFAALCGTLPPPLGGLLFMVALDAVRRLCARQYDAYVEALVVVCSALEPLTPVVMTGAA